MNQQMNPFVSVIIPAYNAEATIRECISSLLNQSYAAHGYEIIVVDDGSNDATYELVSQFPVIVIRQENTGPASARNAGADQAKGEIVIFTDSDCLATPSFIEEMVKLFADPTVVGVKGAYQTTQKELWARFAQIEFEERYAKLAKTSSIDFVDSHAAAFRIDIFKDVGGFDPHFPVANNEDVDLSYKIARLGYKMVFNPNAIVIHRHPNTARKYLRIKFFRAYWRMLVYRRFPEKILSDTYTPQTLKLQILAIALMGITLASAFFYPMALSLIPYLLGFYLLALTPFLMRVLKIDPKLTGFAAFAITCRSIVFGFGVMAGFLSQRRRDLLFPSLLIITDFLSAGLAYCCAYWFRVYAIGHFMKRFDHPFSLYLSIFPIVFIFWMLSFHSLGLYRTRLQSSSISEFAKVTRATSLSVFAIITVCFFWKWDYSRAFLIFYWIFAVFLGNLVRNLVRLLQLRFQQRGYLTIRSVLVGSGETGKLVMKRLRDQYSSGARVIGIIDDKPPDSQDSDWNDIPFLGTINSLEAVIRANSIDEVYIARTDIPHHEILDLVVKCEKTGAGFKVVSDQAAILTAGADLSPIPGLPLIDLREERNSWGRRVIKRMEDLIIGGFLFFIFLPLFIFISLMIHLTIGGSIFTEEERVGKNGRLFKMLRFRVHKDCTPNVSSIPINAIGKFLRKTYLEELPQILNVMRGEMSLVGPRPEVPEIVAAYAPWQRKRLELAPGLTGLWQVAASKDRPLHEDLEYDFYYIKNHDIWMDLSLLIRTIPLVAFGKGKLGV